MAAWRGMGLKKINVEVAAQGLIEVLPEHLLQRRGIFLIQGLWLLLACGRQMVMTPDRKRQLARNNHSHSTVTALTAQSQHSHIG